MQKEILKPLLIMQSSFTDAIEEIQKENVKIPKEPIPVFFDSDDYLFPKSEELLEPIENISAVNLDLSNIDNFYEMNRVVSAYDESIYRFTALEGSAYFISHALVILGESDYIPICKLTFYFYTRSRVLENKTKYIKYTDNPDRNSHKEYVKDKLDFLLEHTPSGSVLFIDGGLIAGDYYTYMIDHMDKFLAKDIITVFFVKNSQSNLVTEQIDDYKNKFNSDLHWAFNFLKSGQRTTFFRYTERNEPKNSKIFCYLKGHNLSPQRVEFHVDVFKKYRNKIDTIMDFIYYLILVQGDLRNPQVRPIAIAEKYARAILQLPNIDNIMRYSGLMPTMNQVRFR